MAFRVLLTGATGLIGRATVEPLVAAGHEVVAVSRGGQVAGAHQTLTVDLLNQTETTAALEQVRASHLIHLAWHDDPRDRWSSPKNHDWSEATVHLVRGFANLGGQRAICMGSCAEYDWANEILPENSDLRPNTVYGQAKVSTGAMLSEFASQSNLSLAWARLFFCYGHKEPKGRLLGDILTGITAGQRVACTDGRQMRDFLHTADVGRALTKVLASKLEGAVNIGSGVATPVKKLVDHASSLMGRPDLIDFGAIQQPDDTPMRLVAEISRLKSIGFEPEFDIEAGIQDCVSHFNMTNRSV